MKKKKILMGILSVLLIVSMLVSFTGCDLKTKMQVRSMLSDFQKSCNALDVDATLNYIDPNVASLVRTATGIIGMFTGSDAGELFAKLSGYLIQHETSLGVEFFRTLKIKVNDITLTSGGAVAAVTLTYTGSDGAPATKTANVSCYRNGEQWYISGISFTDAGAADVQ
ncbi:MAG: hypothetical protein IJK02_01415 [Clostridia bacterium]|nr:hypothetical protein [Clostridia bacterium]